MTDYVRVHPYDMYDLIDGRESREVGHFDETNQYGFHCTRVIIEVEGKRYVPDTAIEPNPNGKLIKTVLKVDGRSA